MRVFPTIALDRAAIYRVLSGLVVPRPIAWVSTTNQQGTLNLAPFSFFTVVSERPPMVGFSVNVLGPRGKKDTVANIEATREFVVNFVDSKTALPMDVSSGDFPPEVDEFKEAKLTPAFDTVAVKVPRVAESPASFECRSAGNMMFGDYAFCVGEILAFHFRDGLTEENLRIHYPTFEWVGRLAGGLYCRSSLGIPAKDFSK